MNSPDLLQLCRRAALTPVPLKPRSKTSLDNNKHSRAASVVGGDTPAGCYVSTTGSPVPATLPPRASSLTPSPPSTNAPGKCEALRLSPQLNP